MVERHEPAAAGSAVVTAADMVAGHVLLDVSCLDRLYLNGYAAKLQTPGGVVYFFRHHRGKPIVSPALFEPIGEKIRRDRPWPAPSPPCCSRSPASLTRPFAA